MKNSVTFLLILLLSVNVFAYQKQEKQVVVYSNSAYLTESCSFDAQKGFQEFVISGLPGSIVRESLFIEQVKGNFDLIKQEFDQDVFSFRGFLASHIGKPIRLMLNGGESLRGTLLHAAGSEIVIRNSDVVTAVTRNQVKSFSIEGVEEIRSFKPVLRIQVNSRTSGKIEFDLHYLTGGLNWSAEYTGHYNSDKQVISLQSWARMSNSSGIDIEANTFSLIAGEVNLQKASGQVMRGYGPEMKVSMEMAADAPPEFSRQEAFIYHRYVLNQTLNLPVNREQRLRLFDTKEIAASEEFVFDQSRYGDKVAALITFDNDRKAGFGEPIPTGTIRIYEGKRGESIYLGGDRVNNIPVGGEAKINIGFAFDVTAKRTMTNYQRFDNRRREETYSIILKNASMKDKTVIVRERFGGQWEVVKSSQNYDMKDAGTVTFDVVVPAGEEVELTFTIRHN